MTLQSKPPAIFPSLTINVKNMTKLIIQEKEGEVFTVYILRTSSNTLYIGQTNNLDKRLKQHREKGKRASKYVRSFATFELVYSEKYSNRHDALVREIALKKLTKRQKETLIITNN